MRSSASRKSALANTFVFDFEAAIHNLDGATKARELVITTAQKYLTSLSTQDSTDPALRRELAEAWAKLARLQGTAAFASTSHLSEAISSFRKSLGLRRALGDDQSANPELRRTFLVLSNNLVNALIRAQRSAEALPESLGLVRNAEAFYRALPASRDAARSLYVAHHSRALVCLEVSDAVCATESAERSLSVISNWGSAHPGDRRVELDTCAAELYVAQAAAVYGQPRRAREAARSMVARAERIDKQWPGTPESRRNLTLAWQSLGMALAVGAPELPPLREEAAAALRRAVALADAISSRDSGNTLAAEDALLARSILGGVLAESNPVQAVELLLPLRDRTLSFLAGRRDNFTVQKTLADIRNDLGKALRATHHADRALPEHLAALTISDAILAGSPDDAISRKARVISLIGAARDEQALRRLPAALAHLDQAAQALAAIALATPADASLSELKAEIAKAREENQRNPR